MGHRLQLGLIVGVPNFKHPGLPRTTLWPIPPTRTVVGIYSIHRQPFYYTCIIFFTMCITLRRDEMWDGRWEMTWEEIGFDDMTSNDKSKDCCCDAQKACTHTIGTLFAPLYRLEKKAFQFWSFHPWPSQIRLDLWSRSPIDPRSQEISQEVHDTGMKFILGPLHSSVHWAHEDWAHLHGIMSYLFMAQHPTLSVISCLPFLEDEKKWVVDASQTPCDSVLWWDSNHMFLLGQLARAQVISHLCKDALRYRILPKINLVGYAWWCFLVSDAWPVQKPRPSCI